jgi:hypothetical protein
VNLLGRFVSWVFPPGPELTVREMLPWSPDIISFIEARVTEIQDIDPDGASKCRQVIVDCCDRIDISYRSTADGLYMLGEINNMGPLKRLARNWADHPDFRPGWGTP